MSSIYTVCQQECLYLHVCTVFESMIGSNKGNTLVRSNAVREQSTLVSQYGFEVSTPTWFQHWRTCITRPTCTPGGGVKNSIQSFKNNSFWGCVVKAVHSRCLNCHDVSNSLKRVDSKVSLVLGCEYHEGRYRCFYVMSFRFILATG